MTVSEHLHFYARIRGVEDPRHNAAEVMKAVGLQAYAARMAGKLSGGNKRKLSLGIALMGELLPSTLYWGRSVKLFDRSTSSLYSLLRFHISGLSKIPSLTVRFY